MKALTFAGLLLLVLSFPCRSQVDDLSPQPGWERSVIPGATEMNLLDVAWTGDLVIAVGTLNRIFTSPDAIRWTERNVDSAYRLAFRSITFSEAGYVVVGTSGAPGAHGAIAFSPDAESWRLVTPISVPELWEVIWTGSRFVAVGGQGCILSSGDGVSWSFEPRLTADTITAVASSSSAVVAGTNAGAVITGWPGQSWKILKDGAMSGRRIGHLHWTGHRYLAAASGRLFASTDVGAWSEIETDGLSVWSIYRGPDSYYLLVNPADDPHVSHQFRLSKDLINFDVEDFGAKYVRDIAWSPIGFVVVTDRGLVLIRR